MSMGGYVAGEADIGGRNSGMKRGNEDALTEDFLRANAHLFKGGAVEALRILDAKKTPQSVDPRLTHMSLPELEEAIETLRGNSHKYTLEGLTANVNAITAEIARRNRQSSGASNQESFNKSSIG